MKRLAMVVTLAIILLWGFLVFPGISISADAKGLYKWYCASCHGEEGKGDGINSVKELPVSPTNHTDTAEMKKRVAKNPFIDTIKGGGAAIGKSEIMPAWEKTLTNEEMKALDKYVHDLCKC